jgi:hypothetical protein
MRGLPDMSTKDDVWKEHRCREAATLRLSKWSCDNPQTPNALEFLSSSGELVRVVDATIPALKQELESGLQQGLDPNVVVDRLNPNVVDNALSRVIHDKMLGSLVTDGFCTVKFRPWQDSRDVTKPKGSLTVGDLSQPNEA